jgi:hypothetical protein
MNRSVDRDGSKIEINDRSINRGNKMQLVDATTTTGAAVFFQVGS